MRHSLLLAVMATGLAGAAAHAQDFNLPPTYATVGLTAGFVPDPRIIEVEAGGNVNADRLGRDCVGFIGNAPDVRLNYQAGNFPLYLFAQSREDTTLVVNLPDGSWLCNDDMDGLNPGLVLQRPPSGQYDIWVGTFSSGQQATARLGISEIPPRR